MILFPELDTPCVLIDYEQALHNMQRFQDYCNQHGLQLRPHIKTHKLIELGRQQLELGAVGITCQKIGEAEVFVAAGFDDILITYNILGEQKLKRLQNLRQRANITVVADNFVVAQGLSAQFSHDPIAVLVECDTGAGRCGVQTPAAAAQLAAQIDALPGTRFEGLMTYPKAYSEPQVNDWLSEARALCLEQGLAVNVMSSGGTPSMWQAHLAPVVTEYRIGTYVYFDRSQIAAGACSEQECALTVLTTVVSQPTPDRIIIDAGSKALTSDLLGLTGFGLVKAYPEAEIYSLSEEHGCIDFSRCADRPQIGQRLQIIPNHACPVSNLYDQVYVYQRDEAPQIFTVAARGKLV